MSVDARAAVLRRLAEDIESADHMRRKHDLPLPTVEDHVAMMAGAAQNLIDQCGRYGEPFDYQARGVALLCIQWLERHDPASLEDFLRRIGERS